MDDNDTVLDRLCRYMTDVNRRGEKWHFYRDAEGYLCVVADFPPPVKETDDRGNQVAGYVITTGVTKTDAVMNILQGHSRYGSGSYLDVPLLSGLSETSSIEELCIRLTAFGY